MRASVSDSRSRAARAGSAGADSTTTTVLPAGAATTRNSTRVARAVVAADHHQTSRDGGSSSSTSIRICRLSQRSRLSAHRLAPLVGRERLPHLLGASARPTLADRSPPLTTNWLLLSMLTTI